MEPHFVILSLVEKHVHKQIIKLFCSQFQLYCFCCVFSSYYLILIDVFVCIITDLKNVLCGLLYFYINEQKQKVSRKRRGKIKFNRRKTQQVKNASSARTMKFGFVKLLGVFLSLISFECMHSASIKFQNHDQVSFSGKNSNEFWSFAAYLFLMNFIECQRHF